MFAFIAAINTCILTDNTQIDTGTMTEVSGPALAPPPPSQLRPIYGQNPTPVIETMQVVDMNGRPRTSKFIQGL